MKKGTKLLTPTQAAEILGVDASTLRRNRGDWGLTRVRLSGRMIRYRSDEIDALIEARSY
ncbi:helix-turn-helix transcriptional regulator [Corynebacterium renale]|uniref:helix-turn-helix transcriptional regulator n=1 Tax=Corynebacterium renale TaxID=1724 RepID=UPI000DFF6E9B|nr:helix-turn-helix domain-containing protein [Corynebacterium renale]STC97714.1 Helix-turn-helix domain [Corynebacterium renale]STD70266.1 Helix-turn-helix domain [Corynebacterium renale]